MDEEVQHPNPQKQRDIDLMSVDELQERINELKAEIELCEAAINRKGSAKSAADAMFSFNNKA
ncbi:MAG: hypothetical protein CMK06_00375 [Ponticaulis sp.]|nr:hypothetical protein [Ponticaulis sp.]|tara:strand:+ start:1194 stop:1382 length:189 start_codon:yes stop_codon:yes gene_type:complete